jgi:bifunctional UDP-N-acetylglucosamine pyrophosphorylase/glucosamine-1-phosphate N-acetyltransferase
MNAYTEDTLVQQTTAEYLLKPELIAEHKFAEHAFMDNEQIRVVILAAGKGTRMKSERAKVMHELFFAPMLHHVLVALAPLRLLPATVVVTGHQAEKVEASLASFPVAFARQTEQLGTAHAVLAAREYLRDFHGTVLILCGDTPLIRGETIREMLDRHRESGAPLTVMTTGMADPANYGRIISGPEGEILRIVEEKDATAAEKAINEINAGVYCAEAVFLLDGLGRIDDRNRQREFYLTDLVGVARAKGVTVTRYFCPEPREVLGVNSRVELAEAHHCLQQRRNRRLMLDGVTITAPETVAVAPEVEVGRDTVLAGPLTVSGTGRIGAGCRLGPQVVIRRSRLGDGVTVEPFSLLADCEIPAGQLVAAGTIRQG